MIRKGVVLYVDGKKDGSGDRFPATCKVKFSRPTVPVVVDFKMKDVVGNAKLRRYKNKIYYTINLFLDNHSLTYLVHPSLVKSLYPAVFGLVIKRNSQKIMECEIKAISIQVAENADKRIKRLG